LARFEIHDDQRVVFRDALGKPMFLSPEHGGESACRAAIVTIRSSAVIEDRYEQRTASDGMMYFVLRSIDDVVLGSSAHYDNAEACTRAIEVMRIDAPSAQIVRVPSAGPRLDDIRLTRQSGFVVVATDMVPAAAPPEAPDPATPVELEDPMMPDPESGS
jgi:hypothetical protein